MRKSLIITVAIILLCLCGCEAVVPVSESSEPQKTSDQMLACSEVYLPAVEGYEY